jgi:hypothetical protein
MDLIFAFDAGVEDDDSPSALDSTDSLFSSFFSSELSTSFSVVTFVGGFNARGAVVLSFTVEEEPDFDFKGDCGSAGSGDTSDNTDEFDAKDRLDDDLDGAFDDAIEKASSDGATDGYFDNALEEVSDGALEDAFASSCTLELATETASRFPSSISEATLLFSSMPSNARARSRATAMGS